MDKERIQAALDRARMYIDYLTVASDVNVPEAVVADEHRFFTWDNEKRTPGVKPYLYDWSYYNGVVMEGLFDIVEAGGDRDGKMSDYVRRYLDAMIVTGSDGKKRLSPNLAGYVDHHGADCYKTAALLVRASNGHDDYMEICRELYRDLTDETYVNSTGHIVAKEYTEAALGHNYWHSWAGDKPPKFKVWLDGIYMLQPFIAHYAALTGDTAQLKLVNERLAWVASSMLAPNGMYFHAANSQRDVCPFHWTRAMGWYGMAMVDVMEVLPEEYIEERKASLRLFVEGMLKYQKAEGLWTNLADWPVTATNRLETSGTAMIVYTVLKGIRHGWLDKSYLNAAVRGFLGMVDWKIRGDHLEDIYLKASANNTNNYEIPEYYLPDEGKGAGPFIMAYSEMLY